MLAPMNLIQHSEIPICVVSTESFKSPQNLFQVVCDVQDIINRIADNNLSGNVDARDRAIVTKSSKSRANMSVCCVDLRRRLIIIFVWLTNRRVMLAQSQFVQTPSKRFQRWSRTDGCKINKALSGR